MSPRYMKSQDQPQPASETGQQSKTQQSEIRDIVDHFENLGIPSFEDQPLKAAWPQKSCQPSNSSDGVSPQKRTGTQAPPSELRDEARDVNGENLEKHSKNCTSPVSFKFTFHDVSSGFQPHTLTRIMESEDNVGQRSGDSGYYTSRPSDGNFSGGNDEGYESS